MESPSPADGASSHPRGNSFEIDWLLHKRDYPSHPKDTTASRPNPQTTSSSQGPSIPPATTQPHQQSLPVSKEKVDQTAPTTPASNVNLPSGAAATSTTQPSTTPNNMVSSPNGNSREHLHSSDHATVVKRQQAQPKRPESLLKRDSSLKKEGRRSSWFTSLGHKLAGSSSTPRNSIAETPPKSKSPQASPNVELGDPFDKKAAPHDAKRDSRRDSTLKQDPSTYVPQTTRRPSVLVAAGSETKLDNPGFLSTAFRRLSSSNAQTLGKGAGSGAVMPRRIMNVDYNRERVKIADFDQNKLKRVAFCVDVEIAGIAAQADEEPEAAPGSVGSPPKSSEADEGRRDSKSAKYKEKGEGAALKNPEVATEQKDQIGQTVVDAVAEQKQDKKEATEVNDDASGEKPTTRKKEKKKRSEAERKERKERKRRHAEANGLVPLEITREGSDTDSSPNSTPGTSTPRNGSSPTTDPLRIYKRCCALRETPALSFVKDQISKPAATLAEAPGTVAVIDLSGINIALQDLVTLGDWLAVVPVRKLILEDCSLTDEGVRVILSGLLSCKTAEQARLNRKLPRRTSSQRSQEQMCIVERLSLKNNPYITSLGWKHIALFMHMSRSLVAIDLSGIPYPKSTGESASLSPTSAGASTKSSTDIGSLIARAIGERMGTKLDELILSGCQLSAAKLSELVDAAIKTKVRRFGLAGNNLDVNALPHIVRYVESGVCEGLDFGGNNLHGIGHLLSDALEETNPLFAISLSNCNLTPDDLIKILPRFTKLKNFKFMDLSKNHGLFQGEQNAVPILRKFLPRMKTLKRIHLADVDLHPDHIIGLAEMLPDCSSLAHVNLLENQHLVQTMNSKEGGSQEAAAGFLASLMTAVRVSRTIAAIELEVPSADSSEVVRALSSQIVAYSLRNFEKSALTEAGVQPPQGPSKDAPEVLLHLVGHMDGYTQNLDNDEPAPDEDYLIASTGIVKALGVCLNNKDISRGQSRNISPSVSGTATPRGGAPPLRPYQKPRDVSQELCETARKIRLRLRPALVREDKAGNADAYRRLAALDQTLERMIQRFEEEYPSTKIPDDIVRYRTAESDPDSADVSRVNSVNDGNERYKLLSAEAEQGSDDNNGLKLSRTGSNTSLAAKALTHEEGRMHRFGQSVRREILKPTGTDDYMWGTTGQDAPEPEHLAALRARLEGYQGDEIRAKVELQGPDAVLREIGVDAEELMMLKQEDPQGFETFKNSQMAAQINAGQQPSIYETGRPI